MADKKTSKPKLATFKTEDELYQKAMYVAWWEDRTSLTKFLTDYMKKRVDKFEKENGPITPAMIKKMEESK